MKHNTIWDKLSADIYMKKKIDSKTVYYKKFLNTKIKSSSIEVADFYDINIPQVDCIHTYLAVTILDSILKKDENYCTLVLLK